MLNYSEPNFCKNFRDLDLILLQFAGLACGANQLLNHVLHRWVLIIQYRVEESTDCTYIQNQVVFHGNVCIYVRMVIIFIYMRVSINRVRLPILLQQYQY